MVNRVVSTKISEEEHGRIVEMCNDIGITVSTMVKRAIRERVKKEEKGREIRITNEKSISKIFTDRIRHNAIIRFSNST